MENVEMWVSIFIFFNIFKAISGLIFRILVPIWIWWQFSWIFLNTSDDSKPAAQPRRAQSSGISCVVEICVIPLLWNRSTFTVLAFGPSWPWPVEFRGSVPCRARAIRVRDVLQISGVDLEWKEENTDGHNNTSRMTHTAETCGEIPIKSEKCYNSV